MKEIGINKPSQKKKQKSRTGKLIISAFEILSDTAMNLADFTSAFLEAGYGASSSRIQYLTGEKIETRSYSKKEVESKCRNLIFRLKRDGLISEINNRHEGRLIHLTAKGRARKKELMNKLQFNLDKYPKEESSQWIVLIFDIPEKYRSKRDWLRAVIRNLGYEMVQQSVWIGKIKIPKEFIEDLKKHKMIDYVEFFQAQKMGSLQ